jgi:hypothetical protein
MSNGKRHGTQLVTVAEVSELQVAFVQSPRNEQHELAIVKHISVNSVQNYANSFDM